MLVRLLQQEVHIAFQLQVLYLFVSVVFFQACDTLSHYSNLFVFFSYLVVLFLGDGLFLFIFEVSLFVVLHDLNAGLELLGPATSQAVQQEKQVHQVIALNQSVRLLQRFVIAKDIEYTFNLHSEVRIFVPWVVSEVLHNFLN
jgi:hypothetical protein